MGIACIIFSLWDRFGRPEFRVFRASIFIALGGCGLIPTVHYFISFGSHKAFNVGAMGWFLLTAFLYLIGAVLYASRIPERFFPGKFDIWVSVSTRLELTQKLTFKNFNTLYF
jgi:adiponectin receptor